MSRNVKISAALVALVALVIAAIAIASGGDDDGNTRAATTTSSRTAPPTTTETAPTPPAPAPKAKTTPGKPPSSATVVVAPDPRTLGRPGGRVTFTEFLDFECPACGAAYPLVEQLRQEYAGRVTFNIRYFPLPSHRNAMPAALAAEAAAQQGRLEPMYKRLFETQPQWGGKTTSQAPLFRAFAREIGLDMTRYDADIRRRATRQRVRRDLAAAAALELEGTPSFFIDEQPVTPQSPDQLRGLLDDALNGRPLPAPAPHAPHGPDDAPTTPMTEA